MSHLHEILVGDVREKLDSLPDVSVQCVVTSPPYWGLRDYGQEGQLGLEPTPGEYVASMVEVFREVRRVMRGDGTLWLNLGDTYAGSWGNSGKRPELDGGAGGQRKKDSRYFARGGWDNNRGRPPGSHKLPGLKPKDLCLIPFHMAIALQADGWWVRSDIIWAKPNPFPESCTDRPTKAHEYIFLLTKSAQYYYDADAIREKLQTGNRPGIRSSYRAGTSSAMDGSEHLKKSDAGLPLNPAGRNVRSVWTMTTQSYPEAHFATFPEALPERCIKAGTSERGCCWKCGAPWLRVVEITGGTTGTSWHNHNADLEVGHRSGTPDNKRAAADGYEHDYQRRTVGWRPTCKHYPRASEWVELPARYEWETQECYAERIAPIRLLRRDLLLKWHPLESKPCTVLDPFSGTGATGAAACNLGRRYIGIELNPEYAAMSERRIGKALHPNTFVDETDTDPSPLFGTARRVKGTKP